MFYRLPPLANRVDQIEPFHVMELVKRAVELERAGRSIIHLTIGEPDFTAPQPVVDAAVLAAQRGATGYTGALGTDSLRHAIATHYQAAYGVQVDPRRIVVTAGASAALLLACCALINPGDGVLLTDPGYPRNRNFIAAFGGTPQLVAVDEASRFQLDARLVAAHWKPNTRGVLLASPANPTGTAIAHAELGKIVALARDRQGFTVVDEIYLGLTYDGPIRTVLEFGDDIVVTNSFSKYFNITGWRLGWLVVPPAWMPTFEKLAQNLFICPSTLAQHAALACFEPESMVVFKDRRDEFRRRRDYIVPALRALGFGVPVTPDGAFYVYVDCSRFTDDSERFANELLNDTGVALVPGLDFGVSAPRKYLRLSYATDMSNLEEAVRRMGDWLPGRVRS